MNLLDQIKQLYDAELYEDVKFIASHVLTLSEHNPDMLSVSCKFQMMVYQGDAILQGGEYKRAEVVFRKALQVKKMMNKCGKGKVQVVDLPSEVEVKYKLYQCYWNLKSVKEAQQVLEGISSKQRTGKVNLALAHLYQRNGMDRSAVTAFKEVLRECPLSIEAAQGLLALGVKGVDVESLMKNSLPSSTNLDWLFSWVKGQAFASVKDYGSATQTFKMLDNKPLLRDNVGVLCSMGESQFLAGDYMQATTTLQRAHGLDPLLLDKMDLLAFLLYTDRKIKELESLATQLMSVSETAPEPWTAMGYFCMTKWKNTRAVYYAQKALSIDNRSLEALILKGAALREHKRVRDAIMHYREALRLAPHRFEAHKGLVDCYVASHRNREAISCAGQACKQLTNARSLTLYASVLAKEPFNLEKAKGYLEKAMKMDGSYLEAVYVLADILSQQQHFDKGIDMLRSQLTKHSTTKLHTLLADFLAHTNDHQGALDQYSIALSIDPGSTAARDGMERVEKHGDVGANSSYDVEVDDMDGSDNEADLDASDIESAWSDIDLS